MVITRKYHGNLRYLLDSIGSRLYAYSYRYLSGSPSLLPPAGLKAGIGSAARPRGTPHRRGGAAAGYEYPYGTYMYVYDLAALVKY